MFRNHCSQSLQPIKCLDHHYSQSNPSLYTSHTGLQYESSILLPSSFPLPIPILHSLPLSSPLPPFCCPSSPCRKRSLTTDSLLPFLLPNPYTTSRYCLHAELPGPSPPLGFPCCLCPPFLPSSPLVIRPYRAGGATASTAAAILALHLIRFFFPLLHFGACGLLVATSDLVEQILEKSC